jgi:SAM-dependent methyltransferase
LSDPDPSFPKAPISFEQRWRERFAEFAELSEDDAGIAGWSASGLEARFRFFRHLWRAVPADLRYLDVGCGAGTYTRWLSEQGLQVVGVDYSQPTLTKARARIPASIPLCTADARHLPFPDATFDGVVCFGVLQATSQSLPIARELARVLKLDGVLWIDALNVGALAARITGMRRQMKGMQMHLRYESRHALCRQLENAGFEQLAMHWLPIAPSKLHWMQPLLETTLARSILRGITPMGSLLSHSFVVHARRGKHQEA